MTSSKIFNGRNLEALTKTVNKFIDTLNRNDLISINYMPIRHIGYESYVSIVTFKLGK